MEFIFLVNAGMGLLLVILAIPMLMKKVKPNIWYGFRTRKTLSDERIWYMANQYAGKALLIAGGLIVAGSMVVYWVVDYWTAPDNTLMFVLYLVTLVVPFAWCVIVSLLYLKKL